MRWQVRLPQNGHEGSRRCRHVEDELASVGQHNRQVDAIERSIRQSTFEQVGDPWLAALHEIGRRRWIAAPGQLGLPGHTGVQDLPIARFPHDNVGFPRQQGAPRLPVEGREITLLQRLRCRQGPQGGDHAGKLPVEVVARGAGDLKRGAVLRGAVRPSETDNAECGKEERRKKQAPAEREQVGPEGPRLGQRVPGVSQAF
jgi:hypothetical protein